MPRSTEEQAQQERFEAFYARARAPVMLTIERQVCGCDYGGNSWTTRAEAEQIGGLLDLRPGRRLLDLGAGSGWPGLYLVETAGCDLVLVDLPLSGLLIAAERAGQSGIADRCCAAVADAAALPFPEDSFDALSHSDLLCCLKGKRAVLEACRRVIRGTGRMVFTVIGVAPGLSGADYRRAVANGPEFIEAEADYPSLLERTGWTVVEHRDISSDYAATCRRQERADEEHESALAALIGADELAERRAGWPLKLAALGDGILRRDLFVATPKRI